MKYLIDSMKIDITYTVNSFIYVLRRVPIIRNIMGKSPYSDKIFKKIIYILIILFYIARGIFLKFMYYFIIFFICVRFNPNNIIKSYFHIYFFLTLLGMFINNKLLNTSKKNYFSLVVFRVPGTSYFRNTIIYNTISNFILNSICIIFFNTIIATPSPIYSIVFILYTTFIRFIGESLNIMFYKKYKYIWYSNSNLYFIVMFIGIILSCLPIFNIYISFRLISIITIVTTILGIISLKYLFCIRDFGLIYKELVSVTKVMNSKNDKDYLAQAMVSIKRGDIKIDEDKLKNKSGYQYLNTIFYERHKEILLRSARKYAFIFTIIYIVLIYLVCNKRYISNIEGILNNRLSIFLVIMYFINRGAIITQAMFYNCDHALLRYNFYRKRPSIYELFNRRLGLTIGINLIPSIVISIGNSILNIMVGGSLLSTIYMFLYTINISILFSIHYLVMYYMLQPFDKDLEVKRAGYSLVNLFCYMLFFYLFDKSISLYILFISSFIITIIYFIIGETLVYWFGDKTFRLK